MKRRVFGGFFILAALAVPCGQARADNLRLFNGREFTGLVQEVNDKTVTLDIGIGVVKFRRWEVKDIEEWSEAENEELRMSWAKKRLYDEAQSSPLRSPR